MWCNRCGMSLVACLGHRHQVSIAQPSQRRSRRLVLQQLADPVDLLQILAPEIGQHVAVMGAVAHLSLAFEDLQRLAHGHARDVQLGGHLIGADRLSGPDLADEDPTADLLQHELLGRARPFEGNRRAHDRTSARISSVCSPTAGGAMR